MPRMTAKYGFEWKMVDWAHSFSIMMTGDVRGFLLLLDANGAIRQIYTGDEPTHFDMELQETLTKQNLHWFFYHPFDFPEYYFVAWKNIETSTLERLINKKFESSDLCPNSEHSIDYVPTSWSVMF